MDSLKATIKLGAIEYDYEIIKDKNTFVVKLQGKKVAVIQHDESWIQTSGNPLPDGVFEQILYNIETYYE